MTKKKSKSGKGKGKDPKNVARMSKMGKEMEKYRKEYRKSHPGATPQEASVAAGKMYKRDH